MAIFNLYTRKYLANHK